MTDDLALRMRRARVEDLMLMARGRPEDGIAPEAVAAAKAEIAARELPDEEIEDLVSDLDARQWEDDHIDSKPLPKAAFVFYMFLGMSLIGIVGLLAMVATGRHRMVNDAARAIGTGFVIMMGLAAVFVLIDFLA